MKALSICLLSAVGISSCLFGIILAYPASADENYRRGEANDLLAQNNNLTRVIGIDLKTNY